MGGGFSASKILIKNEKSDVFQRAIRQLSLEQMAGAL